MENIKFKIFNLEAELVEFQFGTCNVISLGEKGRGRILTYVHTFKDKFEEKDLVSISKTRSGGIKIIPPRGEVENKWVARVSSYGGYSRWKSEGRIFSSQEVTILAKGKGAFGDAGRVGDWDDVLLLVPDGTIIKIKRTRVEPLYLIFEKDRVLQLTEEEFFVKLDIENIEMPEFQIV